MLRQSLFVVGCLMLAASAVLAGPVYTVSVDTSALAGVHGGIDFSFIQGPIMPVDAASVSILQFTSGGTLGSLSTIGDVSGSLPGAVTLNNTSGLNDYFSDLWFGSQIGFVLVFSGPAVDSPSGFAGSGSSFAFSIFSDAAGTIPTLTTDSANGYALIIDVNPDGSTAVTNYSNQATVATPEPAGLLFGAAPLALLGSWWIRRRRLGTL